MTQRHINPVSNGNSQGNPYTPPIVGAALGTIVAIGAVQFTKGGADYASIGFGFGGMTIKGVCDYILATTCYHQELREQEADRRNLNGSRIGARPGELDLELKRQRAHACEYETMPVRLPEDNTN
jgi:hypothetical protein